MLRRELDWLGLCRKASRCESRHKPSDRVLRWTAAATLARGLSLARTANVLGRFSNPSKAIIAVESRVGWRSFGGVTDRREVRETRTDRVVVREIGTARTHTDTRPGRRAGRAARGWRRRRHRTREGVRRPSIQRDRSPRPARRQAKSRAHEGAVAERRPTSTSVASACTSRRRTRHQPTDRRRAVAGLGIPRRPNGLRPRMPKE